jgi:large subunit ribosomal protein L13
VRLTGNKSDQKIYRHYSGFIGGLKEVPISRMRERRPEDVS